MRIYLLGKPEDVGTKNDTLSMDAIFEVDGKKVTKPQFVTLAFSSYSAGKPKYQKDHDLQIYTEKVGDATRTTWRTRTVFSRQLPSGGTEEIYLSPAIEYSRILKMFDASLIGIILADSRFGLKKEDIKALKDLTETIEK